MNVGKAIAKHNHSVDFWGTPIDERVSDLQKRIRRGMVYGSLITFFCGYNMREMFPTVTAALAIQTNFIKRLSIIAVEDVGLANPWLLSGILPVLHKMTIKRETRDPTLLARIVTELCASPKSRMCSHLYHIYHPSNHSISSENGVVIESTDDLANPNCFSWLTTRPEEDIWAAIMCRKECISGFKSFFLFLKKVHKVASKRGKSNVFRYVLGLAHFLCTPSEQGDFVRAEMKRKKKYVCVPETDSIVESLLENDPAFFMKVLPESLDVHTKRGKRRGMTAENFRNEGAVIVNAHPLMHLDEMEKIYKKARF